MGAIHIYIKHFCFISYAYLEICCITDCLFVKKVYISRSRILTRYHLYSYIIRLQSTVHDIYQSHYTHPLYITYHQRHIRITALNFICGEVGFSMYISYVYMVGNYPSDGALPEPMMANISFYIPAPLYDLLYIKRVFPYTHIRPRIASLVFHAFYCHPFKELLAVYPVYIVYIVRRFPLLTS